MALLLVPHAVPYTQYGSMLIAGQLKQLIIKQHHQDAGSLEIQYYKTYGVGGS